MCLPIEAKQACCGCMAFCVSLRVRTHMRPFKAIADGAGNSKPPQVLVTGQHPQGEIVSLIAARDLVIHQQRESKTPKQNSPNFLNTTDLPSSVRTVWEICVLRSAHAVFVSDCSVLVVDHVSLCKAIRFVLLRFMPPTPCVATFAPHTLSASLSAPPSPIDS